MECELCGKKRDYLKKARVEGSIVNVCDDCAKYGTVVQFSTPNKSSTDSYGKTVGTSGGSKIGRKIHIPYSSDMETGEQELVQDYGKRIQQAWQKSGKDLSEFAAMLNEKSSVISKLISGNMRPNDQLVKKLERKLKITLNEPVET